MSALTVRQWEGNTLQTAHLNPHLESHFASPEHIQSIYTQWGSMLMESFTLAFISWQYNSLSGRLWKSDKKMRWGGFQDNPGWEKDAVKDIMIAGMELVDMINNWKHQAWVREMGFSNDCEPSNTCLRQDHRYNYCRAKYKMATHNCCCEDSKLTPISPLRPAGLIWTCHNGGWGQILSI